MMLSWAIKYIQFDELLHTHITQLHDYIYLTITIPQARMGSESIAQEAELVGQKNIEIKHLSLVKARL